MGVGVVLVTHGRFGRLLLDCMRDMLGELPMPAEVLEVRRVQRPELLIQQGSRMIKRMLQEMQGDERTKNGELLLLTDAFGSTPSNIAGKLSELHGCPVVAGVNIPMLVRVFNYPQRNVEELADMAVEGGRRGIVLSRGAPT